MKFAVCIKNLINVELKKKIVNNSLCALTLLNLIQKRIIFRLESYFCAFEKLTKKYFAIFVFWD